MYGRNLAVAALLWLPVMGFAQSSPSPRDGGRPAPGMLLSSHDAEGHVIAGRKEMMAFRLDAAEARFQTMLVRPGNDEAARYHLAGVAFVRAMFEQREPFFERFFDESDALEDLLDETEESAWKHFFEAENYLMRTFVHGRKGDFLRAAVSAKGAYETYLDALRADPTLLDAETGIGLLKALIGATPPAYRRFLRMLGYTGTIEEGLRLLDHAARGARYNGDQAAMVRDVTRVYMNRQRAAATKRLGERFEMDKNPASGLLYTFALRYMRKPDEAVRVAEEAINIAESGDYSAMPFLHFHRGSALFALNRFDEAADELQRYVSEYRGQSFFATAQVRLGLCYEMLGQRDAAEALYRAVESPTDFDIDLAAKREAGDLLESPLTEAGKALLRGQNAVMGGRVDEAVAELEPVYFRSESTQDERTAAAYWLGRAHHIEGDVEKAASLYVYVRLHPVGRDHRWAPWATYNLARIRESDGEPELAREFYEEVFDYKGDYDFRKSLRRNARMALDRLEN